MGTSFIKAKIKPQTNNQTNPCQLFIVALNQHQEMLSKQSFMSGKKLISFWYFQHAKMKWCTKNLQRLTWQPKGTIVAMNSCICISAAPTPLFIGTWKCYQRQRQFSQQNFVYSLLMKIIIAWKPTTIFYNAVIQTNTDVSNKMGCRWVRDGINHSGLVPDLKGTWYTNRLLGDNGKNDLISTRFVICSITKK